MIVMAKEKRKKKSTSNKEALEYKIEIATQTLDRNIGFVANCDNKTSIVLATFGILLATILTNEGFNEIANIVTTCIKTKTLCSIFYLTCFAVTIFVMALGLFKLGSVLVAKTSEESIGRKDATSRIFFSGIRRNGDCKIYKQRFYAMSKKDILNDLIEQIYINSDIASAKYATYNLGLRYAIIGFISFIVLLLIGIYFF